jgi:serine/threonine-protein kinase
MVVAAAQAAADGLKALSDNGIVGPPPPLFANSPGAAAPGALGPPGVTMGPPLPPALVELEATQGDGTGHEPPEVLGGADWTPAAQVYACASVLWTLLCGQPPHADRLARLAATDPPDMRRADVPEAVVAILRRALSAGPGSRQATPADLATALRDAAARRLGSLYLLDRPIGKGGCGEVWAGRRKASGEPIAVKLLHTELVEAELGRFVREYHILHQLRHPQLVRVDEFFSEGGVFAIVMDLVRGGNLRQYAAQNTLNLTQAASLLAQTAGGLAAVHEAGLVHRDIKPENVLIAEDDGRRPVALLSDFGIARPLSDSEHTQVLGTPSYLAPELALGRAPSQASDVYALGVMAYEVLAGHKPFHGDNVDALLLAHIDKVPQRPEGLSDDVWRLIAACLGKDPQARPTAQKAAAAWAAIAGSRPIPDQSREDEVTILSAHPAEPEPRQPAPRRRRRLTLAAIAAVIVGLATGVYLATRQSPTNTVPANQQFQYPVASTVTVDGTVAVVSWRSDAATMPGFQGYLVLDVTGDRPRPLTATMLGADATSFPVDKLRPGRMTCFYVIAVGVTVPPPQQIPPPSCVTPPTAKPTTS